MRCAAEPQKSFKPDPPLYDPSRNGLSHGNSTRNANMAEDLFWHTFFENYPQKLRLVVADVEVKKKMVRMRFITNNMNWSATSICELYRERWGIEVFCKEVKQTLQLMDFMGYSENAVRWQIWISLLVYLLLRFIAWEKKWRHSFNRLFTLVRGVIWNYFDLGSVMACCDTMGRRKRVHATPEQYDQLQFEFG